MLKCPDKCVNAVKGNGTFTNESLLPLLYVVKLFTSYAKFSACKWSQKDMARHLTINLPFVPKWGVILGKRRRKKLREGTSAKVQEDGQAMNVSYFQLVILWHFWTLFAEMPSLAIIWGVMNAELKNAFLNGKKAFWCCTAAMLPFQLWTIVTFRIFLQQNSKQYSKHCIKGQLNRIISCKTFKRFSGPGNLAIFFILSNVLSHIIKIWN